MGGRLFLARDDPVRPRHQHDPTTDLRLKTSPATATSYGAGLAKRTLTVIRCCVIATLGPERHLWAYSQPAFKSLVMTLTRTGTSGAAQYYSHILAAMHVGVTEYSGALEKVL